MTSTATMTFEQQSTSLAQHRVVHLASAGRKRYLQVLEGQVWLTVTADGSNASDDLFLAAGDSVELAPHEDAVLEAMSAARFQLAEPAQLVSASASARGRWSLGALVQRLALTPKPSVCV